MREVGDLLHALDVEPNSGIRKNLLARIQSLEADHVADLTHPQIPEPDPTDVKKTEEFWAKTRRLQPELVETLQEFWFKALLTGVPAEAAPIALSSLQRYPTLEPETANHLIPYLAKLTYAKTNETHIKVVELLKKLKTPDDATLVAIARRVRP